MRAKLEVECMGIGLELIRWCKVCRSLVSLFHKIEKWKIINGGDFGDAIGLVMAVAPDQE